MRQCCGFWFPLCEKVQFAMQSKGCESKASSQSKAASAPQENTRDTCAASNAEQPIKLQQPLLQHEASRRGTACSGLAGTHMRPDDKAFSRSNDQEHTPWVSMLCADGIARRWHMVASYSFPCHGPRCFLTLSGLQKRSSESNESTVRLKQHRLRCCTRTLTTSAALQLP